MMITKNQEHSNVLEALDMTCSSESQTNITLLMFHANISLIFNYLITDMDHIHNIYESTELFYFINMIATHCRITCLSHITKKILFWLVSARI